MPHAHTPPPQILVWDRCSLANPSDPAAQDAARRFAHRVLHLISFLHAVACQALRRDASLDNLKAHREGAATPPSVSWGGGGGDLRPPPPGMRTRGMVTHTLQVVPPMAHGGAEGWLCSEAHPAPPPHQASRNFNPPLKPRTLNPSHPPPSTMQDPAELRAPSFLRRRRRSSSGGASHSGWQLSAEAQLQDVGRVSWKDVFVLRGAPNNIRKYNAAQPLRVIQVGAGLQVLCALQGLSALQALQALQAYLLLGAERACRVPCFVCCHTHLRTFKCCSPLPLHLICCLLCAFANHHRRRHAGAQPGGAWSPRMQWFWQLRCPG